jgi:hypothetical protein
MRIITAGPDPEADGISSCTLVDLVRICERRIGKTFHPNFSRPRHPPPWLLATESETEPPLQRPGRGGGL